MLTVAMAGVPYGVALHPEGVDRNCTRAEGGNLYIESPSTRRAWIEITATCGEQLRKNAVALHPEGVDRNGKKRLISACVAVALHPEGVDRNM